MIKTVESYEAPSRNLTAHGIINYGEHCKCCWCKTDNYKGMAYCIHPKIVHLGPMWSVQSLGLHCDNSCKFFEEGRVKAIWVKSSEYGVFLREKGFHREPYYNPDVDENVRGWQLVKVRKEDGTVSVSFYAYAKMYGWKYKIVRRR